MFKPGRLLLIFALPFTMIFSVVSCSPQVSQDSLNASASRTLSWSEKREKISYGDDGKLIVPAPPAGSVKVLSVVAQVNLPTLASPSIAGERATVTFSVKAGEVPNFPKCETIQIKFDAYANPFKKDQKHTLIFLPNGDFWGMEGIYF